MYVDVYFGVDNWCGFTPPDARNNLPTEHEPWRCHATRWLIFEDYPYNRIVPEDAIRAGIKENGYYVCQLSDDQLGRLRGE
jgi:hypothetical protein